MGPSMRGRSWLRFRRMPVRARRCWRILSSFAGSRSEDVRRVSLNSWKKMNRLSGKNCSGESGSLSHSQAKNSWLLRMSFWSGWQRRSSCSALQKMSSLSGKMRKSCSGWQKRSSGSGKMRKPCSEWQKMNSWSALQKRSSLSGWQTVNHFRNFSGPLRTMKNRHGMKRMNCASLSRKSSSAGSSSSERRKPYLKNSAKMKMLKNFWLLCFWRCRKNSWSGHRVPYLRTSLLSRRWKLLII